MCDYSLHHVATRPAKTEDKLVTTKFTNSITRGFAAVDEPHVAVCLLPGTEVAFDDNVECEPSFGIGILAEQEDRAAVGAFPANQHRERGDPSRRAGIPGWASRAAHAIVRGSARDGVATPGRCTSRDRGGGGTRRRARGSRAFAVDLIAGAHEGGAFSKLDAGGADTGGNRTGVRATNAEPSAATDGSFNFRGVWDAC